MAPEGEAVGENVGTQPEDYIFRSKLPDVFIPSHLTLPQYCLERAAEFADKPCLIQGSSGRVYTYAEVDLISRKIASGLAKLGIQKADVVMLLLSNCPEFVLTFLGAATRGTVTTTANPFYTPGEIAKQVKGSGARLIITQAAYIDKLEDIAVSQHLRIITIDEPPNDNYLHFSVLTEADESECHLVDIYPDDIVALPYSSGTTGFPKGVMLTHRSLISSIAQQVDGDNPNLYVAPEDVVLCVLPMFHIYSLNSVILCSLRAGAAIAIMPKFEIVALLELIQKCKVTMALVVPPILLALARNPIVEKYDVSSIRVLKSGAAPLAKDLEDVIKARFPRAVTGQGYGMTEAGPVLAMSLAFAKYPFPVKVGSCGTVVRNAEVKIIDPENGVSLPHNQPGEICIRGPQIMKGYVNDPDATSNTIDKDGFLHTGDVGYIDDDEEVFIVDRVKEIIKFKGFQVPPAELEGILISHPSIADAACVPKKDEAAGEVPVAFVVKAEGRHVSEDEVKQFVAKQVVFYKKLHQVIFVEMIPRSPSGKILRKDLRQRLADEQSRPANSHSKPEP
eukprot:c24460_g3_i1 orf=611-2299(+)